MRVFMIAGEPSGDKLGGALMRGLRQIVPDMLFDGIGGADMQAQGLVSRFPMAELSVMGLAEILPRYRHLKRRIAQTAEAVIAARPDVLITIDSPDFCLRVARLVRARGATRIVHYVAPSVWAWRPERARRMAGCVDQVLALLPFEPPYMEAAGVACDFVGHPVAAEPVAGDAEVAAFRAAHGLGRAPVVLALPGSRRGEVQRLAPIFGAALRRHLAGSDGTRVVVPAPASLAEMVRAAVAGWPGAPVVVTPADPLARSAAFRSAGLALAASGTVSLELAAAQVPMVIGYRFNWLTWQIMSRMALIDTVTLVNLVSDTRVVPECLGPGCTPAALAAALAQVAAAPDGQLAAMDLTMHRLGQGGADPGLRAARAVLDRL
ncbi:MAG: lipid-A-disaccharide synthase [Rhodobacteraceae bacterium]|nr:lipid-A-disaccharide synthase [Paracoccaceae bacterium]